MNTKPDVIYNADLDDYSCYTCEENHYNILAHLRDTHGMVNYHEAKAFVDMVTSLSVKKERNLPEKS